MVGELVITQSILSEMGTIQLNAYHQGGFIMIEISDYAALIQPEVMSILLTSVKLV